MSLPGYLTSKICWNGTWSDEVGTYGVIVQGYPKLYIPERDIEEIEIPGRNFPMLVDNDVFKPFTQSYTLVWRKSDTLEVENWLYGVIGYGKLQDSIHGSLYREAYILGGGTVVDVAEELCQSTISFKCKPFWNEEILYDLTDSAGSSMSGFFMTAPVLDFKWASANAATITITARRFGSSYEGPPLSASITTAAKSVEAVIDCEEMLAYYKDSSGVTTNVSPTIKNGWPELGYHDGFKYNYLTFTYSADTKPSSITLAYKELTLI